MFFFSSQLMCILKVWNGFPGTNHEFITLRLWETMFELRRLALLPFSSSPVQVVLSNRLINMFCKIQEVDSFQQILGRGMGTFVPTHGANMQNYTTQADALSVVLSHTHISRRPSCIPVQYCFTICASLIPHPKKNHKTYFGNVFSHQADVYLKC